MRKLFILGSLFFAISQSGFTQQVGDDFPEFEPVPISFFNTSQLDKEIMVQNANLISKQKFKKNQKYDRIVCKVNNVEMWFSGKYKEMKYGHQHYFKDVSPLHYVSTNQIYNTYERVTQKDLDYRISTVYHDNGKIWRREYFYMNTNRQLETEYDKNGLITREYSLEYRSQKEHPEGGTMQLKPISPMVGAPPNYHTYKNGNSYLGYQYVGTLFTTNQLQITGFFGSLNSDRGFGGVFFVENTSTHKCSWITVLNQKIIAVKEANCDEKPDIHKLNEEIVASEYKWVKENISKKEKEIIGIDEEDMKLKLWFSEDYLEVSSSKEPVLNGYHFNISRENNVIYNDVLLVTCGTYKNGKLEGMGFKARIDFSLNKKAMGPSTTTLAFVRGKWDLEAGHFENGTFKKGRKFNTLNYYFFKTVDIYSDPGIANFEYIDKGYNVNNEDTVSMSKIRVGNQIYSEKLKRVLQVIAIDTKNGTITTPTDIPGKHHTFHITKDQIYFHVPAYKNYTYQCNKTVLKPFYKEKKELLYYEAGENKISSYTVKGAYYDKRVTTIISTQGKPVYATKYVIDGYENVPCPKCNGEGFTTVTKDQGYLTRVVFN